VSRTVLRHFPQSRLAVLAARNGGLSSDDAVAAAAQNVEQMRSESDKVLGQTITALEMLLEAFRGDPPSDIALARLRTDADRLVSLSGMFGLASLGRVARSLCDLLAALSTARMRDLSGLAVHVRALRLTLPGAPPMTPAAEARILEELEKLVRHYDR
jgi:hypothetical protein